MVEEISKIALSYVKTGDLYMLKYLYNNNSDANDPFVFQKVFLGACIHKKIDILIWLNEIYNSLDCINKIGLKPTIIHGKYVIKDDTFLAQYNEVFREIFTPNEIKAF
tara:strand:+ start:85 stop:408 length:324 start_codon:yes stop_codon:yes gene_type:complete